MTERIGRRFEGVQEGHLHMTMLAHGLDDPVDTAENRDLVKGAAKTHLPAIRRFFLCALTILSAGGMLAGAIALKTAIYFWRHNF
jgi:hypothetical protein